ncbi:MAG: hypothetical protein R3240_02080 [Gammaproteobacteria bacterium]|nr:hypothetical protein [Gammaproteobacteria bacterium]
MKYSKVVILLLTLSLSLGVQAELSPHVNVETVYAALTGKDSEQQAAMLQKILKNSEQTSATILFLAAGLARKLSDKENAAFLFYAGQIRGAADLKNFPPRAKGGNSPEVMLGSLSYQLGSVINAELMRTPTMFSKVVQRLNSWQPGYGKDYKPDWESENRLNLNEKPVEMNRVKQGRIGPMLELSELLSDKKYFDSFLVVQNYNLNRAKYKDDQVMKNKKLEAEKEMVRIEKAKHLKGFMTIQESE